mmetsp:Transcript_38856/g.77070  ORF Transcript_38856/g.77070 Transcript_38856/m.77070 type:complete len:316 (+) Transcript_38856:103-1050(+)
MARKHVIPFPLLSSHRRFHRVVPLVGLYLFLYASKSFVIPGLLGQHVEAVKERMRLYAEGDAVAEVTQRKLEEFKVGDEVEAVILGRTSFGVFCGINADKDMLLSAPWKFLKLLEPSEKFKAKIEAIDLEKRQGTIVIPDLEKLLQGRMEKPIDPEAVEAVKVMKVGQVLSGKVAYKNRFGVWVDLGSAVKPRLKFPGKFGKLHGDKLRFGEEVEIKVVNIDVAKGYCDAEVENIETIVAGRPERKQLSTLEEGSVHVGHISLLRKNRAWVDIDFVRDGLMRLSHDGYQPGKEVKVKVASVDIERDQFELEVVTE